MRVAFVDFAHWDYTVDAVGHRPLGGSQTALCCLASELAQMGHDIFVLNGAARAVVIQGVYHSPLASLTSGLLRSFDAVVVLNAVKPVEHLRPYLLARTPIILWTQHAADQPAVQPLTSEAQRRHFAAIAFVSQWQRYQYAESFSIDIDRTAVMRNAVAPVFLTTEPARLDYRRPVLAYTSTPFRGLDLLIERIFPRLRQAMPETTLKVFSSMAVYQMKDDVDRAHYGRLYDLCRNTPGVEYRGSIAQPELAVELSRTTMLAYPNHFAETSCIALLEALASGCMAITSRLGALPESTGAWGQLLVVDGNWDAYCDLFVEAALETLQSAADNPTAANERRAAQIAAVRRDMSWSDRAKEWGDWLARVATAHSG